MKALTGYVITGTGSNCCVRAKSRNIQAFPVLGSLLHGGRRDTSDREIEAHLPSPRRSPILTRTPWYASSSSATARYDVTLSAGGTCAEPTPGANAADGDDASTTDATSRVISDKDICVVRALRRIVRRGLADDKRRQGTGRRVLGAGPRGPRPMAGTPAQYRAQDPGSRDPKHYPPLSSPRATCARSRSGSSSWRSLGLRSRRPRRTRSPTRASCTSRACSPAGA